MRVRVSSVTVDSILVRLLNRCAEVLLQVKLGANCYAIQTRVGQGALKLSLLDIFNGVVGDKMMRDAVQRNAHRLLHQTIRPEAVAVNKGTNKLALYLLVAVGRAGCARLRLRGICWRRRSWWESVIFCNFVLLGIATAFGFLGGSFAFHCALLLARRERLLEFAINQEVSEDTTRAPSDTIRPALDA
jgi:hypothetical protein